MAAARFLQARNEVAAKQISFGALVRVGGLLRWPLHSFWAPLLRIALSGGGLSPAETELFDIEYKLTKAGYTANEVKDAIAWQRLKNEIIASPSSDDKWDEYAKLRLTAQDAKWFRHQGIDVWAGDTRPSILDAHAALLCLRSRANAARLKDRCWRYSASLIRLRMSKQTCARSDKSWIRLDAANTPLRFTQTDRTT